MPAEKIPGWIERLLLPKLSEISGDVKALDIKIESLRNEMKMEIGSLRNETKTEIASVRKEIEKMAALELRIAELEKRLAVA